MRHGASATTCYFGFIDTEMVHKTLDEDPLADDLLGNLPGPLRKRLTPDQAGEAVARGIEKRAPRVIVPPAWRVLFHLRGILGALMILLFGFLFVTVSSRLTGEVGSSSNPISGMTIATLLLTCLVFVLLDQRDRPAMLTALSVAAVVCIASSNGGTTSQDLKTGFLVGATPKFQQYGILIGTLTSAVVIGGTSLFGGRGRLIGTLIGALIVQTFAFGLSQLGVDQQWRVLATGILVIVAVAIDQWIRKVRA